jgi:hypothetical protein
MQISTSALLASHQSVAGQQSSSLAQAPAPFAQALDQERAFAPLPLKQTAGEKPSLLVSARPGSTLDIKV